MVCPKCSINTLVVIASYMCTCAYIHMFCTWREETRLPEYKRQAHMLCKVTHCAGCVLANSKPHQLHLGDWVGDGHIAACTLDVCETFSVSYLYTCSRISFTLLTDDLTLVQAVGSGL